ncbi:MAG: alpha/beta hydrolase [Cytophagales bacterium]|nr:alpha/beta hydrolase [Cytophagales bacterium]
MADYKFSYSTHGSQKEILFLFHGFGQDRAIFDSWLPELTKKYTVYTLDLFYHGKSTRQYGLLLKGEWRSNFSEILTENSIDSFSVLGFSLGGRFAIATALEFKSQVNHLYLIAPDAVYHTPWFHAATFPGLKLIFKYYMLHPVRMNRLIKRCVKLRIISRYMADFVKRELSDAENQKRIYISWNHFKPLGYSHRQLRKYFKNSTFKKILILGKKDIVIPPKKILPILKGCGFDVIILDKKHHQLVKEDVVNSVLL